MNTNEESGLLTLKKLNDIPCGEIFASGTFMDSIEDIPLCSPISNKEAIWVAVKGERHQYGLPPDWAIYASNPNYSVADILIMQRADFLEGERQTLSHIWTPELVKLHGGKLTFSHHIKKLVPCTDEVFKLYRY